MLYVTHTSNFYSLFFHSCVCAQGDSETEREGSSGEDGVGHEGHGGEGGEGQVRGALLLCLVFLTSQGALFVLPCTFQISFKLALLLARPCTVA